MSNAHCIRAAAAALSLSLSIQSSALLGAAALTSVATASGTDTACEITVIPDSSCIGDACRGLWVGATEAGGVRHVVWKQYESEKRVMTARIDHDGVVTVSELPIATSTSDPLPIKAIAVRADLLAVGVRDRLELFRLIDGEWTLEQSMPAPLLTGPRRLAIGIGPEGLERVVASSRGIIEGAMGFGDPVRVYRKDAEWTLEQELPVPFPSVSHFGADIAVDGSTIVVGAPQQNLLPPPAKELRVYELIAGVWEFTGAIWAEGVDPSWSPNSQNSIGARITLAGDTIVTTLTGQTGLNSSLLTGIGKETYLQIFHRGPEGWVATQTIGSPSTRFGLGFELDSFVDGDDVIVTASMHRKYSPVFEGAVAFRIRDGFKIDETPLPIPSMLPDEVDSTTFGIAAVGGASPWVAVTAVNDPAGVVRIIGLNTATCDGSNPADLNGDGVVDGADLGILLQNWGPCPGPVGDCLADLNGDGVIDGADLGILLAAWGANR